MTDNATALLFLLLRHRRCVPAADFRLVVRTLADAARVLEDHGLLHEVSEQ